MDDNNYWRIIKGIANGDNESDLLRKFNMSKKDVAKFMSDANIKGADGAKKLIKPADTANHSNEQVARQKRLDALNASVSQSMTKDTRDTIKEQQDRSEALKEQEASSEWTLPNNENAQSSKERFRRELTSQGIKFCTQKYGVTRKQLMEKADELELNIDWQMLYR